MHTVLEKPAHLRDLNPAQYEAVTHGEGPLLIFAGAGSGKTRVLTRRIANLVLEHNVAPQHIFAVTFTNKAASEMKLRVQTLFGGRAVPYWVSTFHSSAARILRAHATLLDYKENFAIYDTSDSLSALKRVYKKLNIDPKIIEPRAVLTKIDRAKNAYKFSDDIRHDPYIPRPIAEMMADLYHYYQEELRQSNAMDFGDLLCNVITLFQLEKEVLAQYQDRFRHILIDEYQDTNQVQYKLVKLLTAAHQNICVVGDDDQSIYAFRGATIENILNFKKDFPAAKVVTLDINYRSTKNILEAANAVISKNQKRQKKTMRTDNSAGDSITGFKGFDEKDEADFVAREIALLLERRVSPKEIAIFYRTNAQSRALEEALCMGQIPYEIYGGFKFYERKEIKDVLSYVRLLVNPADNEALLRVINSPARGIGNTSIAQLITFADSKRLPLLEAIKVGLSEPSPLNTPALKKKFSGFLSLIEQLHTQVEAAESLIQNSDEDAVFEHLDVYAQLMQSIAQKSGYIEKLKAEDSIEAESRIENLEELFRVAADFLHNQLQQGERPKLQNFLERVSLSSDSDTENVRANNTEETEPQKRQTISMMTLHLAKGLEFDYVFLVGMEEGLLPHVRALTDRTELEEERRLCYVGFTRARKKLYLTRAISRQTFGRTNWYTGETSRFLLDLPKNLLQERRVEHD